MLSTKSAFLYLFLTTLNSALGQSEITLGQKTKRIGEFFDTYHLQSKKIDLEFSQSLYSNLLLYIDEDKTLFSIEDTKELEEASKAFPTDVESEKSTFFESFKNTYSAALIRAKSNTEIYFSRPQNILKPSNLVSPKSDQYLPSNEMTNAWHYWIRKSVLIEVSDYMSDLGVGESDLKALDTIIPICTKRVQESYNDYLKNLNLLSSDLDELFLNAMCGVYDPHSNFFTPEDKIAFSAELQSDRELYGINYRKNERGEIEITHVSPGSSAWLSGDVHEGDIIETVKFGSDPRISTKGMTRYELSKYFDESQSKELELGLRDKQDDQKIVSLIKSRIYSDEDIIKTAILEGPKKLGYISLPDFYTSWSDTSSLGCANDIAKALLKLKREGIEGLILDLRNNGGGSLKEAIDLVGIFIDFGPVMIRKDYDGEIYSMKDFNRGLIYSDPLMVLVDEGSASASEVVAGALQDYNRATIVGRRSYGKATGQSILPLDPRIETGFAREENPEWGYVKITGLGIYRINLSSNQARGVYPDIELILPYEDDSEREENYPNTLVLDSISKKMYYKPLAQIEHDAARQKSLVRQKSNSVLKEYESVYARLKVLSEEEDKVNTLSQYLDLENRLNKELEQIKAIAEKQESVFKSNTPSYDDDIYGIDSFMSAYREDFLQEINGDWELNEAYQIMIDLLSK